MKAYAYSPLYIYVIMEDSMTYESGFQNHRLGRLAYSGTPDF